MGIFDGITASRVAGWVNPFDGGQGKIETPLQAVKSAAKLIPGVSALDYAKDNFTAVQGASSRAPSAVEGATSYNSDGTVSVFTNGQWVKQSNANTGGQDESPYAGGSGGGTGYSADDLAYVDSQMGLLRNLYNTIEQRRQQGLTGLQDSYAKEVSGANQNRSRSLEDLSMRESADQRTKDSALDQTDRYARTLADSVRRRLGMASGADSSAFKLAAPNAVARDASAKRTGVMEDYAANAMQLDLTKRRANEDYDSLINDLESQRKSREMSFVGDIEEQRQGVDQQLAGMAAERARLLGGGYAQQRVAQQPYLDQYNSRQSTIDSLFEKYRTPYTKQEVKVNAPTLRDYVVDKTAINANEQTGNQQYAPYANFLKKEEEKKNIYA